MIPQSAFFLSVFRHNTLYKQLIRREVIGRYKGSLLGIVWAFATPLLMLGVYTFVFVGVFSMRWPGAEASGGLAYSLRLFAGLIVFNFFAEVVSRAPLLILEQPNLVKRVVFPLELLTPVSMSAAAVHLLISLSILLTGTLLHEGLSVSVLLVPIVLLPLIPALLGISWLFSAIGVYVRDLGPLVGLGVNLLLFLSPVFYSADRLPEAARFWMRLNPMTLPIENVRHCLFGDVVAIDWITWSLSLLGGLMIASFGAWVFARVRDGFADVL